MTGPEDYERLYDELSGHREKPPQSNEYNPDDPLGLSSDRVTCTMATLVDKEAAASSHPLGCG